MEIREQILASATHLFAKQGFDGTSLKEIAERVGVRKQSLLYHFPSKEELRLAVLAGVLERWNDVLPRLLMAAVGGEDRFAVLIGEVVTFFSDDPDRARLLLREILDRPDDMRQHLDANVAQWIEAVAGYIRRGQKDGSVHADVDPEAYVLQISNLVISGVAAASALSGGLLPAESPRGRPTKRHTRELVRIARRALFTEDFPNHDTPPPRAAERAADQERQS